jgi:hypothetical protein
MTSLRSIPIAVLLVLAAASAMAGGSNPVEPTPVMGELPTARTANDMVGSGAPPTKRQGGHVDWENVSAEQRAMEWPTNDSSSPVWGLAVFASAILMLALTSLGLTLTYRSLRAEMRRNRTHHRPRGPHTAREPV